MATSGAPRPYGEVDIQIAGKWGVAGPEDVLAVLRSVRDTCLSGVEARDADAPLRIAVFGIPDHPTPQCPAIDLLGPTAPVILCVSGRLWSKMAYQFGHELGHVVANNWGGVAIPRPPSHWLEEALVEAFSLAGMLGMSRRWAVSAPYANWKEYAASLESYARAEMQEQASAPSGALFRAEPSRWLAENIADLEPLVRLDKQAVGPLVVRLVQEFDVGPEAASDLAALNRWPERSALPIGPYLSAWAESCAESERPGRLPAMIRALLSV